MGEVRYSIRLTGDADILAGIFAYIKGLKTTFTTTDNKGGIIQQIRNVLSIDITDWIDEDDVDSINSSISQMTAYYPAESEEIFKMIETIDRTRCFAELYVSYVEDSEQGGIIIPQDMVMLSARLGLVITISTTVIFGAGAC